ncbi:sodium/hydrogen exchanger 10-like isoform X3 [Zophobas morio]|uniref:sodium/hydrogen exchanger 10-like isoform X3 n=1 Tax=Zophobas morio TaxID=2755281 RepID=UPI003082E960
MLKLLVCVYFLCVGGAVYGQVVDDKQPLFETVAYKYIYFSTTVLLMAIVRHVTEEYDLPIPYALFSIILGVVWGIWAMYDFWASGMSEAAHIAVESLDDVFLPVIVFKIAFCIDVHAFFKSLTQILIIAGPIAFLSGVMTGSLMKVAVSPNDWTMLDGFLFGAIMIPIYPQDVLRCLKESTMQTKHMKILLEGETIVSAWAAITVFMFICSYISGWVVWWYQFVLHLLLQIVVGVPISYLFGIAGSYLMRVVYNDAVGIMLVTVAMCYCSYFYVHWIANAGVLGNAIVGILMGSKRASLSQEIDRTVTTLWQTINCIMCGMLYTNIGTVTVMIISKGLNVQDYMLIFVTYLISNITRFVSFFLFSFILSRIGYGMTFQNMIVCVWAGLKNPICLSMALNVFEFFEDDERKGRLVYLYCVTVYALILFINGSCATLLIKTLGLAELSNSRLVNMNTCMKYIYEARSRTVAILKMDRFLADANWPLVMKATALKHPYKKMSQDVILKGQEDNNDLLDHRYTFCPDCQNKVQNEPTPKEFRDMLKEAKLRLLKLKKTAYSRFFENGMMSKFGIGIMHQTIEVAMDNEELIVELDGLYRLFTKEGMFYRVLTNILHHFLRVKYVNLRPPRMWWRRLCYRLVIVHQNTFLCIMQSLVFIHACTIIFNKLFMTVEALLSKTLFYTMLYFTEFMIKIFALSWILVFKHGIGNYFRSYWNVLEFTILVFCSFCTIVHILTVAKAIPMMSTVIFEMTLFVLLVIRLLRTFTLLKYYACYRAFAPSVIRYLEEQIDRYRILAYELGINYLAGEEEMLENLHQIIDDEKIREIVKEKIDSDRLALTYKLGTFQNEFPHVATTVKTKLAMRMVLNSMKDDVHELKVAGWVDDVENAKLLNALGERYTFIDSLNIIQPVSTKLIFREIPYMVENEEIEFLYTQLTTRKFEQHEVVYKEGDIAENIYILISGMLKEEYVPEKAPLDKLREVGALPVVDYAFSLTYEEPIIEYVVPGNSIGELSLLTGRPYNAVIKAETTSMVYVLNKTSLTRAFEMNLDPVNGSVLLSSPRVSLYAFFRLECRIWKSISFKKALTVMMNSPSYRSYTQNKIKYILERAFVPNLSNYKVFVVNEMMADIILIEGTVMDFNSRYRYTGTCYIPRF